jgi:hypothetical protein
MPCRVEEGKRLIARREATRYTRSAKNEPARLSYPTLAHKFSHFSQVNQPMMILDFGALCPHCPQCRPRPVPLGPREPYLAKTKWGEERGLLEPGLEGGEVTGHTCDFPAPPPPPFLLLRFSACLLLCTRENFPSPWHVSSCRFLR